jgi:hypothetical protein
MLSVALSASSHVRNGKRSKPAIAVIARIEQDVDEERHA